MGMEPISRTARKVWYSFPMEKRTRRKFAPELLRKTVNNKLAVPLFFYFVLLYIKKNLILSKILHFRASSVYFEKKKSHLCNFHKAKYSNSEFTTFLTSFQVNKTFPLWLLRSK